jgi:hypothetical protein
MFMAYWLGEMTATVKAGSVMKGVITQTPRLDAFTPRKGPSSIPTYRMIRRAT